MKDKYLGILLITPAASLFFLLIMFPLSYNIFLSFHKKVLGSQTELFIGSTNYLTIFNSSRFWHSFQLSVVFTLVTMFFQVLVGLFAALVVNETFVGRAAVRTVILSPFAIPVVVACFIWRWLFNPEFGVINYLLSSLGIISQPIIWLGREYAFLAIVIICIWKYFPFAALCFLGRLQTISPTLYEAAKLDGASSIRRFIHVTIPQLKEIILIVVLLRGIWMFTKFDEIWILTKGGPISATTTLPVLAYRLTFSEYNIGLGSTVASIIFAVLFGFTLIYLSRKEAS